MEDSSLQPKSSLSPCANQYQPSPNKLFSLFQKISVNDDKGSSSNSSGVSDNVSHGNTSIDVTSSVPSLSLAASSSTGHSLLRSNSCFASGSGFGNSWDINMETMGQFNGGAPSASYSNLDFGYYGSSFLEGFSNQLINPFNQNLSVLQNSSMAAAAASTNNNNCALSAQKGNILSDELGISSSMVNQGSLAKSHLCSSGVSDNSIHGNTSLDATSSVPSFAASSYSHSLSNNSFASGTGFGNSTKMETMGQSKGNAAPTGYSSSGVGYYGRSSSLGGFSNQLINPSNQSVLEDSSMAAAAAAASTNNHNYAFSGQNGNILSVEALLGARVLAKRKNWNKQKLHKILTGDATLINEVNQDEIFTMATLKLGSNYLLDILSNRDGLIPERITKLIFCSIIPLMVDQFGSVVFKKLLSSITDKTLIVDIVEKIIYEPYALTEAATTELGVSSIQELVKIAKKVHKELVNLLISAFGTRELLVLMKNHYGSRLIKFFLVFLNFNQRKLIYNVAMIYLSELATSKQGCITLKTIMETLPDPFRHQLMQSISNVADLLSYHCFGNFVIQHVIELDSPRYTFTEMICEKLKRHYVPLSMDKCGSFVVEKCILCTVIGMQSAFDEFWTTDTLLELAQNRNGNYVIQSLLEATEMRDESLHRMLVLKFNEYSKDIKNLPHASGVYNLINGGKRNKRRQQV